MDRKTKRQERRQKRERHKALESSSSELQSSENKATVSDERFAKLLAKNEDELLSFATKINSLYKDTLGRPAPFVTFVICGMQSSGKSTIMERFLNNPLNIVQVSLVSIIMRCVIRFHNRAVFCASSSSRKALEPGAHSTQLASTTASALSLVAI